jgi:hypothetical protein
MISDRMSVSSRHLLIEGAHPSRLSRFVDGRAHFIDDFGFVRHEPQERSGLPRRRWPRGILVSVPRGACDERASLAERKLPDGGEELIDGRCGHEGQYTSNVASRCRR